MVEPLGNGKFGIRDPGSGIRRVAYAVADKGRTWVFIDGHTYVIEREGRDAPSRRQHTDAQLALSAPMPATVVAIEVSPGQQVAEGDLLIMLEAMKMELPITAPYAGRVTAIACKERELVEAGVPLVEIEP